MATERGGGTSMTERAALVTGGSGGIGYAIAERLGRDGYGLTISGRQEEKLMAAADRLRGEGLDVEPVVADLSKAEQAVALVAAHRERWGRLDCLVNNAGIGIGQGIGEISEKFFDLQVAVNLKALVVLTRESFGMLQEAGGEHGKALVVNLASVAGKAYPPWLSIYGATKAAVISFSQSSQKEFGESGVQVTAICPGFVETDMTEFVKGEIPPEKMIRPEDLGEVVAFLLSTSPNCVVPEIVLNRPGTGPDSGGM